MLGGGGSSEDEELIPCSRDFAGIQLYGLQKEEKELKRVSEHP